MRTTNNTLGAGTLVAPKSIATYPSIQELHVQQISIGQYGYYDPSTTRSTSSYESSGVEGASLASSRARARVVLARRGGRRRSETCRSSGHVKQ